MQGRDMIGRAKTGTGKTLAFGIPIMDKIIQFNKKHGFVVNFYVVFLIILSIYMFVRSYWQHVVFHSFFVFFCIVFLFI